MIGWLEVFVPAEHYRSAMPASAHREYDDLLARAAAVHRLDHIDSTSESHMDASIPTVCPRSLSNWLTRVVTRPALVVEQHRKLPTSTVLGHGPTAQRVVGANTHRMFPVGHMVSSW